MARVILKDLGIIEEKERKVDVTAHLKMLWEEEDGLDESSKGATDKAGQAEGQSKGNKGNTV